MLAEKFSVDPEGVPVGAVGELCIGGDSLARGYLNQTELTAERFMPNPFSKRMGERLYKTGDIVRYRADGNLEFVGRIDSQVKIRGYRIELGEIESALSEHAAVRQAVLDTRTEAGSEARLVAYLDERAEGNPFFVGELLQTLEEPRSNRG